MLQVSKFAPEITRPEFEYMSDETFSSFVLTLEKTYNDRIEAERKAEEKRIADEKKAEEERIAREEAQKLHEERKNQILPYWNFIPLGQRSMDFPHFLRPNGKIALTGLFLKSKKTTTPKKFSVSKTSG